MTVRLNRFLVYKTNRCTEFQITVITTLHVSGSLSAHHQEFLAVHQFWYILCSCDEPFATRSRMAMQCHPTPGSKRSQLHKVYQTRCTTKNSWWWAERLPETCRVVITVIWNSVHLLVLFIRNIYGQFINLNTHPALNISMF